jgi:hypothetical protein
MLTKWQIRDDVINGTSSNETRNCLSQSVNSLTAAETCLETKLIFRCAEKNTKSVKYAQLKDFGYNWTNGDASEIVNSYCFSTNVFDFRWRIWVRITKRSRYVAR